MIAFIVYLLLTIFAFLLYGVDKARAQKNQWRISEKTLLLVALLGGAMGAYWAMQLFRHKTKHGVFRYSVPLLALIQITLLFYFCYIR